MQDYTKLYTALQSSTKQLYTSKVYTSLQNITSFCKLYRTLYSPQNFTKHYNIKQHTQFIKQTMLQFYTTLQNFSHTHILYILLHNKRLLIFTKPYKTLPNFTKTRHNFYTTQLNTTLHNSTKLDKTFQHFHRTIHNNIKLYRTLHNDL